MLLEITDDLSVSETESTITTELLRISESEDHPLHLCSGLLIHEIRNIWKTLYKGESDIFAIVDSLQNLRNVVDENISSSRTITVSDLVSTFTYSKNELIIASNFQFENVEQFLCVRTLVDNSLAHGDCEVRYNHEENAFEIIDITGKPWKEGYWQEVEKAYESGKTWDKGQRFALAERGKTIVAAIMGIRGYLIPKEIKDENLKGIKLSF